MSLFRLDASIRTVGSHSREIADVVEREWRADHRGVGTARPPLALHHVGALAAVGTAGPDAGIHSEQ